MPTGEDAAGDGPGLLVGLLVADAILEASGGSMLVGPIVGIVVGAGLTGAGYVGGR